MENSTTITVTCTVHAPAGKVWACWTEPQHIMQWYFATDDWHAPHAENDLRAGGSFKTTMASKDGCMSFDFGGTYDVVETGKFIEYHIGDGRKVSIRFEEEGNAIRITENFETETTHPTEMQRAGWQAILDNFKKYVEALP